MRLSHTMLCVPLLGACTGMVGMGTDASMGTDGAMPREDAAMGTDAAMGIDSGADAAAMGCMYPPGAVDPMARDAVMWPYRWPEAIGGDGTNVPLDLQNVPCAADENIDWSPFDVLVFIAIPGW